MKRKSIASVLSKSKYVRKILSKIPTYTSIKNPRLPDWGNLLTRDQELWELAHRRARGGPRVLIATTLPGFQQVTILETMLAVALTLRGAEVHMLLCDRALPGCLNLKISRVPDPAAIVDDSWRDAPGTCNKCRASESCFVSTGLPIHYFSQHLTREDRERSRQLAKSAPSVEIPRYQVHGMAVGEHAYAGCLRYFSTGNLEGQKHAGEVLRRYFEASLLTTTVVEKLLGLYEFDVACFHHGIYIPQGIVGEVCRARGVRVVNWNPAYRKRCFIFSHDDTYHHTLLNEPTSAWENMRFDNSRDREIQNYLRSRWTGSRDWIWFHRDPDDRDETLIHETGIDLSKPIIGLLTNVMWDAQLHYRANAFPDMLDWLIKTIRYFDQRPDLQLLIRVHPAEIQGTQPSRQFVVDELRKLFDPLPSNVFVIPPESDINTYSAMAKCNSVIIYGTKTGVELTSMGIPVIVAGEAWIRNKGLTIDASSEEEYLRILDTLPTAPARLPEEKAREARKYAYHFFLRRMIPLKSVAPCEGKDPFKIDISGIRELAPGVDYGLDIICDGILKETPFIYRSELVEQSE